MSKQGIILEGRYSEWKYYNSDHAFLAGKKGAKRVQELRALRDSASFPDLSQVAQVDRIAAD